MPSPIGVADYPLACLMPPATASAPYISAPATSGQDVRPIRSETRLALVTSIAFGRRWLDEIVTGAAADVEQIAAREKCSVRQVNMKISLAFLSPTLVKAAIEGRLPRGVGVARLRDAPAELPRDNQGNTRSHPDCRAI
jgi:hypothetical protein